ncbi:TonB-dependent siderophore receptor [Hydrogenophaga electricum]|uniref:Ferric siderophore receptor n=1 Tax=Hydrogenophaga electricum TaxID=1230953 RepID=A0ABQ6CD53_9BURK|nr:TonB-dependent receptor [Hydrogenophaga electricum]GLS16236.1 ferric siderophore receptor [Hydrogenophaga electricum]
MPSFPRKRWAPAPLALAASLALTLAAGHAPLAHAQDAAAPVSVQIPALPLGQALNELARQARLPLTFPAPLVAGKTAPAVTGAMTVRQALDRLLAGSGLAAAFEGGAVVVRPAPPRAPGAETTLKTVTVTASAAAPESPLRYLSADVAAGALGSKSVLDTPFSLTVVDSESITERGARSIGQIFVNDPSVYTPTSAATTDWWGTQIRGLGVRNSYIDDIPMLLYWGGDFPTEVVESVTALKGLTGFMYGFGEPGGALSYQLKRPKAHNETTVDLGLRNPGLWSVHVDTSRVLDDGLALRANIAKEDGKAYNGARIDRTVASLAVDKVIDPSLKWFGTLTYEDSRNRGEPLQFYLSAYDTAGSGGRLPRMTYVYDDVNVDNGFYNTKTTQASTGLRWDIDGRWRLTTQIGASRREHYANKAFADLLNLEGDYAGNSYNFAGKLDNLFTQAVVEGRFESGAVRHELVGGVGIQQAKDTWSNDWYWVNDFNGNLYQRQPFRTTRAIDFSMGPLGADTRQTYAFASDTVHFGPHWQAIVGLRYTDYRVKDLDGDPSVDSGYDAQKASPTLALIYKPDPQTSYYGSYVEGLEAGTRVAQTYANAGEMLGATVSRQYEVGVKRESGGVDYTAALFRIERANQMDIWRDGARYLTQDGLLVYQGAEFSGAWQATRNLNLGFGAIYLDGAIDKVSADNAALQGNTPANAAKWQVVANTQYRVPGMAGLKLHGNVRYYGALYASDANDLKVPAHTVANAGFSYDFRVQAQPWTLIGNIYNLFNTRYWAAGGWSSANQGEARNVSLVLRTRF